MLKDRFAEACRSLDCAYAIDFKDGGRLLSPLRSGGIQPVPGSAATGTWEVRNGLITPSADAAFADGKLSAGYVNTQIDLRGRTTDFTLLWRGVIATPAATTWLWSQSPYTAAAKVTLLLYAHNLLQLAVQGNNGSFNASMGGNAASSVAQTIAVVFNLAGQVRMYADGILRASKSIPQGFALPTDLTGRMQVNAPCEGFAFYDRALTAEEVAAI